MKQRIDRSYKIFGTVPPFSDPEEISTMSLSLGASYWLASNGKACLEVSDSGEMDSTYIHLSSVSLRDLAARAVAMADFIDNVC